MITTRPASPSESPVVIPPTARMSLLAMAALENGVSPADVHAYLGGRATKPLTVEVSL